MTKKILFINDDFLPITSGGNVDIYGQLQLLNDLENITIDVAISVSRNNASVYESLYQFKNINQVFTYEQNKYSKLRKVFSPLPYSCFWFYDLLKHKSNEEYDYVVCQSEYSAFVVRNNGINYKHLVIRVHNDEIGLLNNNNRFETNIIKKFLSLLNVIKLYRLRNAYYNFASILLFISQKECFELGSKFPDTQSVTIPPYYRLMNVISKSKFLQKRKQVLFLGGFSALNLEGLKWYFDFVHVQVKKILPDYTITIAGKRCVSDINWLLDIVSIDDAVDLLIDVPQDSVNQLYENHYIAINPMQHGNGTKIKTTEYIYHGLPVITTAIGADGNMLDHGSGQLIANSPHKFVNEIVGLYTNQEYAYQVLNIGQRAIVDLYKQNIDSLNKVFEI